MFTQFNQSGCIDANFILEKKLESHEIEEAINIIDIYFIY